MEVALKECSAEEYFRFLIYHKWKHRIPLYNGLVDADFLQRKKEGLTGLEPDPCAQSVDYRGGLGYRRPVRQGRSETCLVNAAQSQEKPRGC